MQPHRRVSIMDDCDELIPEWLKFVKDVADSVDLPLNISYETLQRNKILRVIKKNHVKKCLGMFAELAERKDDYMMSSDECRKCMKLGLDEDTEDDSKIAELLKSGDEQMILEEYVDRMKGELNDKTIDMPVVREGQVPTIQTVQKTVEVPQVQFLDRAVDVPVVAQRQMPQERVQNNTVEQIVDMPASQIQEKTVETIHSTPFSPKGRLSQTEFDHVVQEGEMYQDEDETKKTKIEDKNGMEKYCVATKNTVTEEKLNFKCEAGGKEKPEKAVQSAGNWSDKSPLGENDEFEAQHKELDRTDTVINVPVPTQHQVPIVQSVETTVGGPKVHSISEVINTPAVKQRRVSTAMQTARKMDQTFKVAKVIPHERILRPTGERASVRERVRLFEMNGDMSYTSTVEVPRATPDGRQSEDPEDEAPNKRRKQESDPDSRAPVHFSLCDGSSDQETKSVEDLAELVTSPEGEREGFPVGQLDDVLLEVRDVKSELLQFRNWSVFWCAEKGALK